MKQTNYLQITIKHATRLCLLFLFLSHVCVAACYGWLSPKGFALNHSRFWLNTVLPVIVVAVGCVGVVGLRKNTRAASSVTLMFASGWLGAASMAKLLFPQSLRGLWGIGLVAALLGILLWRYLARREPNVLVRLWFGAFLCAVAGSFVAAAQVPPMASTRPLDLPIPGLKPAEQPMPPVSSFALNSNVRCRPQRAEVVVSDGEHEIHCYPLLSFDRISPDGFWSLLAPKNQRVPRLLSVEKNASSAYSIRYDTPAVLTVSSHEKGDGVACTAWTELEEDTYSHLNSYLVLLTKGHEELALEFSPCPGTLVEVLPADYPTGRPARFAYLNAAEEFVVVEATSGEKGPFRKLAEGRLRRGEPLKVRLYDRGEPFARVMLEDWSAHVSTALSPTAGWQIPMNAIEFRLSGDGKNALAEIYVTLAATSVGRGWETVGHRAGTYRNRLLIRMTPNE